MRLFLHALFLIGYSFALSQYLEFAFDLFDAGLIEDPFWSTLLGKLAPHHGYVGFAIVFVIYLWATRKDYVMLWRSRQSSS